MDQGHSFSRRVWQLATAIPPGRVTTYGDLAKAAGGTGQAARSVMSILGKAPNQKAIPYHRIVYSNGRVWLAPEYKTKRLQLYKKENIKLDSLGGIKNFAELRLDFNEW